VRIAPYVRRTPVLRAAVDGRQVSFKLEHLQVAGVFKIRGALNGLLSPGGRPPGDPPHGGTARPPIPPRPPAGPPNGRPSIPSGLPRRVVTASGGNHGLGVATAARWLGVPATVYVPGTVPEAKARRIAAQGADVVKTGSVYADAERAARSFAAEHDLYYVHAYDDPAVVAGQGTLGLEIAGDMPDWDAVAVPVGGGGLLAGVAGALFSGGAVLAPGGRTPRMGGSRPPSPLAPGDPPHGGATRPPIPPRRVVAVEPEGCPTLHAAVAAGEPVEVGADSVAASALGASRIGDLALAATAAYPVSLALVGDEQIVAARDRLWEEFRLAVEPAAATVFAAWLAGQVPGDNPCLVLSGGNADWTPA